MAISGLIELKFYIVTGDHLTEVLASIVWGLQANIRGIFNVVHFLMIALEFCMLSGCKPN